MPLDAVEQQPQRTDIQILQGLVIWQEFQWVFELVCEQALQVV